MSNKYSNTKKTYLNIELLPYLLITLFLLLCILAYFMSKEYNANSETLNTTQERDTEENKPTEPNNPSEPNQPSESKEPSSDKKPEPSSKKEEPIDTSNIDDDFFDKSLFIGDSRTVGFEMHSGLTKGTFYSHTGLAISDLSKLKFIEDKGKTKTVYKAIKGKSFDKIFISLGLNELGWPNVDTYKERYLEAIRKIQKLQPDSKIYIISVISVTKEKNDSEGYFTLKNVKNFNSALQTLADNQNIFFIDVNKNLTNSNGYLLKEASTDGIHLTKAYYQVWYQTLKEYFVQNN